MPNPSHRRNRAVGAPDAGPISEKGFAARDSFDKRRLMVREPNLSEARVDIDERSLTGRIVLSGAIQALARRGSTSNRHRHKARRTAQDSCRGCRRLCDRSTCHQSRAQPTRDRCSWPDSLVRLCCIGFANRRSRTIGRHPPNNRHRAPRRTVRVSSAGWPMSDHLLLIDQSFLQ